MKSITLIACTAIIAFTLTAFTYSNWSSQPAKQLCSSTTSTIDPPIFAYDLSPRYKNTITKERMHNAKTISDLLPDYSMQEDLKNDVISLRDVKIRIEEENVHQTKHSIEEGVGNSLSNGQLNLLKSADYSTNFVLEGNSVYNSLIRDIRKEPYFNYYMTVVPEQQASYSAGKESFIEFLTSQCQPTIDKVEKGNLKSGMISFTVTKSGAISNIDIKSTCGYPSVDEKMMDLMNELPDAWNVATNDKGEKVNQNLVFSYGQTGC